MKGVPVGEAVLSASWRQNNLSQDSHVLFMSVPLACDHK